MEAKRITVRDLAKMKAEGRKITTVTSYDAITARLVDEAGIQLILVGDSAGNTVLGYENTIPVTLEESLMLTAAVRRGAKHAMVIGDMPFMSYQVSEEEAVRNAGRYLKEAGADGVKLEGGRSMLKTIRRIVDASIPVFGHVGLLPQSVLKDGGYRIHGRNDEAEQIIDDALAVQEAGAFAVGAGPYCDGQIQVVTDILGLGTFVPRHAKVFTNLSQYTADALKQYREEVEAQTFPAEANSAK